MNKKIMFAFLLLFVLTLYTGCTIEGWDYTYSHHGVGNNYDGELEFTLSTPKQPIEQRMDHASVVFDNKIWIFGGYNPNARGDRDTYLEDIWYTEDGISWVNVTMDAPFKGRRGHEVVVFEGDLYLIGGFRAYRKNGKTYGGVANDVWKSPDGINWTEIKPNSYKTRVTHPSLPPHEDVRGIDLYDPSDDLTWYPRLNHKVIVADLDGDSNESMYLLGGYAKDFMPYLNDGRSDQTRKYFADIWQSDDGIIWTQLEPMYLPDNSPVFGKYTAGRASFGSFLKDNDVYLVGGTSWFPFQENGEDFVVPGFERVWKRSSGNWSATSASDSEYTQRRGHEIVAYDGDYWIFPGSNPAAIQWYHGMDSIWKIDGTTLNYTRDGSYRAGNPMYGIANYTAEVFTPLTGIYSGEEAIFILFGDGDGGVRNTTWRVVKQGGGL